MSMPTKKGGDDNHHRRNLFDEQPLCRIETIAAPDGPAQHARREPHQREENDHGHQQVDDGEQREVPRTDREAKGVQPLLQQFQPADRT